MCVCVCVCVWCVCVWAEKHAGRQAEEEEKNIFTNSFKIHLSVRNHSVGRRLFHTSEALRLRMQKTKYHPQIFVLFLFVCVCVCVCV